MHHKEMDGRESPALLPGGPSVSPLDWYSFDGCALRGKRCGQVYAQG
jgi:hypothetical protein